MSQEVTCLPGKQRVSYQSRDGAPQGSRSKSAADVVAVAKCSPVTTHVGLAKPAECVRKYPAHAQASGDRRTLKGTDDLAWLAANDRVSPLPGHAESMKLTHTSGGAACVTLG